MSTLTVGTRVLVDTDSRRLCVMTLTVGTRVRVDTDSRHTCTC